MHSRFKKRESRTKVTAGFTLFELLISVLVLAVGLLGLATMQAQGLKMNNSAEKRTEATFLAMDIMDRMRATMVANNNAQRPPVVDATFGAPGVPVVINDAAMPLACAGACSIAQQDLRDWAVAVRRQLGAGVIGNMGWGASIVQRNGVYIVTLMWDDERTGAVGTACSGNAVDMACFQTLFQP